MIDEYAEEDPESGKATDRYFGQRAPKMGYAHRGQLDCPLLTAPAHASVLLSSTQASLAWIDVAGADSFDVFLWKTSQIEPTYPLVSVVPMTYLARGLSPQTQYTWRIIARFADLKSIGCGTRTFTTA